MTVPEAASSAVAAGSVWLPALSSVLGALVGGLLTGTFTLVATAKQQKAQLRRESMLMRQKWIETIGELIPEIINTAGWFYMSKMKDTTPPSPDGEVLNADKTSQTLKLAQQIIQVELMLDPDDETHVAMKQAMRDVRACAFASGSQLIQFEAAVNDLTNHCAVVLKRGSGKLRNRRR